MAKFVRFNVACGVKGVAKGINEECIIDDSDFNILSKMFKLKMCYVTELDMNNEPGIKERILQSEAEKVDNLSLIREEVQKEFEEKHGGEIADLVKKHEDEKAKLQADFATQLARATRVVTEDSGGKRKGRTTTKRKGEES